MAASSRESDFLERTDVLLGRARSGDAAAQDRLFRRYRDALVAHARSKLRGFAGRRLDAEDLVQTAFANAWANIRRFEYEKEGSFQAWLVTIVLNTCRTALAAARNSHDGAPTEVVARAEERAALDKNERDERSAAMWEAMGVLPEEDRFVLIWRDVENRTFEEIGDLLERSREHARARYAEAQERLWDLLKP